MPPHLHPRSKLTSSLFATTLFASFFVVSLPHLFPCPAPRMAYLDDGTPRPRRRRKRKCIDGEENVEVKEVAAEDGEEAMNVDGGGRQRECPIPKPGGLVGGLLGFKEERSSGGRGGRPD